MKDEVEPRQSLTPLAKAQNYAMLTTMKRWIVPLAFAAFAITGLCFVGAAMRQDNWMFSATAASWAQAFGTILVVAGAAWIAVRDGRERAIRDTQKREAAAITVVMQLAITCKVFRTCLARAQEFGAGSFYPKVIIPSVKDTIQQLQGMPIVDARNVNIQLAYQTMLGMLSDLLISLELMNSGSGVIEIAHTAFVNDVTNYQKSAIELTRGAVAHTTAGDDFDDLLSKLEIDAQNPAFTLA